MRRLHHAHPLFLATLLGGSLSACVGGLDGANDSSGRSTDDRALEVLVPDEGDGTPGSTDGSTDGDGDGVDGGGAGGGGSCGAEICDGGDRPPPSRVEDCGIPNCNGFMGHGDEACWQDNSGGCSAEVLDAWCTRRSAGDAWDELHRVWVDEHCNGDVTLAENGRTYQCQDVGTEVLYECTTPLVLVFDGVTPVTVVADDGASAFNLAAPGAAAMVRTDWPTAATPWLALDRNHDGAITSGEELFGSATRARVGIASNGFEALAALDDNGDGVVDGKDSAFNDLVVWSDSDANRVSRPGELLSLRALGIVSFETAFSVEPRCDARGNCEIERAAFTWIDLDGSHQRGAVVDVHLAARDRSSRVASVEQSLVR